MVENLTRRQMLSAAGGVAAGAALGGLGIGGYKLLEGVAVAKRPDFVMVSEQRVPTAAEIRQARQRYAAISAQEHNGRGLKVGQFDWSETAKFVYEDEFELFVVEAVPHDHSYAIIGGSGPIMLSVHERQIDGRPSDTDIRITLSDLELVPLLSYDTGFDGKVTRVEHPHPALDAARASDMPLAHSYTHSRGYWTCVGTCLIWAGTRPLVGGFCTGAYWSCRSGIWPGCVALAGCVAGSLGFCLWHC